MKKKILLTGSNGLLGQKLITLLTTKKETIELIATAQGEDRLSAYFPAHTYTYYTLDVTNHYEVDKLINAIKPHIVIHTAAMTNVDQCEIEQDKCWLLNVKAVEYITKACQYNHAFLIHLSTDFIFDGKDGPYDETASANPLSHYGKSKLEAEKIITQINSLRWAIARTMLVYGVAKDMSRNNIVLWIKKNLEEGKPIQVINDQWRTPTLAEDLAMGCYQIAEKEATGIFNISGKDMLTPYQMAIEVADFFNLNKQLITETNSKHFTQPAKRPSKTGFIITKATEQLNYQPHSFKEGLQLIQTQLLS